MSRIGKKPIEVPAGVKVSVSGNTVELQGPKGKDKLVVHPKVKVAWSESEKAISVSLANSKDENDADAKAQWGTTRALVRNMIEGVTKGYEKTMQVVGTGWTASLAGKNLKLTVGMANAILMPVPEGLTVVVEKQVGELTPIKVSGVSRQLVGQFASAMRAKRKPEPYNGKGIKYAEETIKRKQGKQFGA
ncbi:MAG: 50S ribosomal protein L6 [Phycisphaeraceae bacterium]|nr:50S ribosomal protein L6 [Phycisphaeraceae bacterium]